VAIAIPVQARPAYKQALSHYFGSNLPKSLNACTTCHLPDPPGKKDDGNKPHNAFGLRLKSVKEELRKANKPITIEARLDSILDEDSDGDGVSNLLEILTGHAPGNKSDRPTAKEIDEAKIAIIAFERARKGHAWRPFEVVKRPSVPSVKNATWVRNPIDAFVAAEHEAFGLKPRPEAPAAVLLRRVYLDLIGLPPTPAEQDAFLKDESPRAFEKVVDDLLARPQYGERWGRHWMDVWRYSDWAGYGPQVRDSQPHIWHWRDWIIDSLNADKGYDRMILEMLAGDELAPEDPQALVATGYLVRNFKLLSREKWMQDTVEHTFLAFQGVTLHCAKCHDHMFDPILQSDYYQVRAIFEPHNVRTDRVAGQADMAKDGLVRVYDKDLATPTLFFIRGDDRTPDKDKKIVPGVPEALGGRWPKLEPIKLPPAAVSPDKRDFVIKDAIRASKEAVEQAKENYRSTAMLKNDPPPAKLELLTLETALAQAKHDALLAVLKAESLEDAGKLQSDEWQAAAKEADRFQRQVTLLQAHITVMILEHPNLGRKVDKKGPKDVEAARKAAADAERRAKEAPTTNYVKRALTSYPAESSGRRLAFARWVADARNPLTARVAVNHIWLRHFGQAIVPSVFDFGKNGRPPSHPALLDWLAAELMDSGEAATGSGARAWSMKPIHRLIATSATYRQASTPDEANTKIDRDNKYLWRHPPHRLEAEAVRDCIFHVAGKLDLVRSGPDIDHKLGLTTPRRSLYFRHAAEKQMEFLQLFDAASVTECYERQHSIVPQQALALLNSEVAIKHARILARSIAAKSRDPEAFAVAAYEHVLSRRPTSAERGECVAFLADQTKAFQAGKLTGGNVPDGSQPSNEPLQRAFENLVHALLNHHEFVTIR
jgi:hypothetical protein